MDAALDMKAKMFKAAAVVQERMKVRAGFAKMAQKMGIPLDMFLEEMAAEDADSKNEVDKMIASGRRLDQSHSRSTDSSDEMDQDNEEYLYNEAYEDNTMNILPEHRFKKFY